MAAVTQAPGEPGSEYAGARAARGAGYGPQRALRGAPRAADRWRRGQRAEAIVMSRPLRSTLTDVVDCRKATNDSGSEALNTPLMVRLASVESATWICKWL